ncbi:MAG: GIY-YIG nuclease family protein [Thermosynechococcus sp.]|uniref:GIY-YIG nuclease family protein n=1 Tax=Thermosynechococcus sp. TaxID=2814275 RepID=UPI00391C0CEA
MTNDFFPRRPKVTPKIYAYEDTHPQYKGLLKVGYTTKSVQERVAAQYPTLRPGPLPYRIVLEEDAICNDGTTFTDHDVHRMLRINGIKQAGGEWFRCTVEQVKAAINAVRTGQLLEEQRSQDFGLRPEQEAAIQKTMTYFQSYRRENGKPPHFLWNCKMRFGKTFAAYQLAKRMNWRKVLVLTFKPAVQSAWEEDLRTHVDFEGWQFIKPGGPVTWQTADKTKPIVCFGSFQDYLGRNPSTGGIKTKNEWVHATHWDCVIFDEYHYGAWREKAKDLFEDDRERRAAEGEAMDYFDEEILPITSDHYLYLSGTPFRAIASGEFIEEQIYNWTYSDEQRAKAEWDDTKGLNPYAALPRMVLMTYQLPEDIRQVALQGEFNEFDLNVFFSAEGVGDKAKFKYENEVQKWLDLIRGAYLPASLDDLKLGRDRRPPLPFSDVRLLAVLSHTLWFLPSVAACYAMRNLLAKGQNKFYHHYTVIVAAGASAGIGPKALPPVLEAMGNPLKTKTITLTCGKLTTGVTVRPWSGIFMLRNTSSPETYFQAAFRVQSPWTLTNPDGCSPNEELILKPECYVFDFAPDRALRQIADYSTRLNVNEDDPEKKVEEFIRFLPVLAYDGSSMRQIDAAGVLEMAMSGTTATLLARRWESALLVNVDNDTLRRLMANEQAMRALMNIEGFRNLNQDIETIINKSEAVKKAKREANDRELSRKEKRQLTEEEREFKSKRKEIQEKLIKFATRIPIFLYLTDYRERTLRDVITQLEPELFKRVTGITQQDFELLVSLGVFNSALMNDAVYKFKRYEDPSLAYMGINRHEGESVGLYDTVLRPEEYQVIHAVSPS